MDGTKSDVAAISATKRTNKIRMRVSIALVAATFMVAALFHPRAAIADDFSDDQELCQTALFTSKSEKYDHVQIWEVLLACNRVQYSSCSKLISLGMPIDRKCRYLLDYPPAPKGYCTLQDHLSKKRNCWSPANDSEFQEIGR